MSGPERSSLPITQIVRAIYDFSGENNDELCMQKGDLITLTQTPEGGWYEGTLNSSGVTGWFPSNYVESVEGEILIDNATPQEAIVHIPDKTNQQYRKLVIKEINDTEAAYIIELKATYQQHLMPLLKSGLLPENELSAIIDAFAEVINVHSQFLLVLDSLQHESSKDQKVGGAFLSFAPKIKAVHMGYCALHPHFVSTIEKNKDIVSMFIKSKKAGGTGGGAEHLGNGSVLLTSSLSYSFRRLDKYPALLQELQRYTDECHPDRGDTQRAGFLYRELVSASLELRRKKEMELEVMLGNIKNWPTESMGPVDALGQILLMGPVTVILSPDSGSELRKDRYLVLFHKYLLLLSISNEMTSFTYENSFLLDDMTVPRVPDVLSTPAKAHLEILMPAADQSADSTNRYVFQCSSSDEVRSWITLLSKCKSEFGNLAALRSSLRRNTGGGAKTVQLSDTMPKRTTSNLTSESSSLSSGSLTNFAKSPIPETRSSYWQNKSLLPHAPLRSPCASLENGMKTSTSSLLSVSRDRPRPSSPSDDMAILQVIESYYFTGKKNQPPPVPSNDSPQIILVDDENIAVETVADGGSNNGLLPVVDERNLINTVNLLVSQVKQMRQEIDSLAISMQKERKARKRLAISLKHLQTDT